MALNESLAQLAGSTLDIVRTRLDLIAMDLEEGAWRLCLLISMGVGAALVFVLALAFSSLAFIFAYWQSSPIWALIAVALAYAGIGFVLTGLMYWWFRRSPFLMSDSIQMIREDQQMLRDLL